MARCPECGAWQWQRPDPFGEYVCPSCGVNLKVKRGIRGVLFGELEVVGSTRGRHVHYARDPSYRRDEVVPLGLERELDEATRPMTEEDTEKESGESLQPLYAEKLRREAEEANRQRGQKPGVFPERSSLGDRGMVPGRCDHCNAVIVSPNAVFCSNCGARLLDTVKEETQHRVDKGTKKRRRVQPKPVYTSSENCMVCRLALIKEDDVVWCPYCGNPAHRKHLLEWVQLGHRCPVCRNFLEERTLLR